jgi:hypothetical protein
MSSIPPTQGSRNSLLTSTTAAINCEVVFIFAARLHGCAGRSACPLPCRSPPCSQKLRQRAEHEMASGAARCLGGKSFSSGGSGSN